MTTKTYKAGMNAKPTLRFSSSKQLLRQLELGSAENFGFIGYSAHMWFVLMMGLIFAFVGFYRIGANYANDYGVRIGATYSGDAKGEERQEFFLGQFTNTTHDCFDCYSALPTERQAQGGFTNQSGLPALFNIQGVPDNFDINAQSRVRLERFYPGPAKCDSGGDCFE
jgi:hypothetical protein